MAKETASACRRCFVLTAALVIASSAASPSLEQILLDDAFIPSSSRCDAAGNSTTVVFDFTPTEASRWSEANKEWEELVFLAEMRHEDPSGKNRTWTARIGTGGDVYSLFGPFGEAIPPQTNPRSPFVDEVTQCVAVDAARNRPSEGRSYFIHQAGAYLGDEEYMPPPFFSPNVAKSCAGNECRFSSFGQQGHVPTVFKSSLLFFHRYRDCGNGVLEYTQGFQNVGDADTGDVLTYLNVPWGGVRTSSLPEFVLSGQDGRMLEKELPLQRFGGGKKIPNLNTMGGFTTFATNLPTPASKRELSMPCYRVNTTEVKNPCTESDVQELGYTRFSLVLRGRNPCNYYGPHSRRFGGYYVSCRIKGDGIPRIDGCRQCGGRMRFTSAVNGKSIVVTDVLHWTFGNRHAYFSSPNATAAQINRKFVKSDEILVTLDDLGRKEDSLALAYVHGVDREFEDAGNDWLRAPGRARFGRAGRDFTVFTINARLKLQPGNTYFNRQYLITDQFLNMEDHANEWVDETVADMLTGNDFEGRLVEMWEEDGIIGVAFAEALGGNSTTCARGKSKCAGSSVPRPGMTPFFAITCGNQSYVGPDLYAFAPKRISTDDPIRAYACAGEDDRTTRPTWTLLGYFPTAEDGCNGAMGTKLDSTFCELQEEEGGVDREEAQGQDDDSAQPSSRPTVPGEGRNIFDHSDQNPSQSPSQSPTVRGEGRNIFDQSYKSPSRRPTTSHSPSCAFDESLPANASADNVHCQPVVGERIETISFAFIIGFNASSNSSGIQNESSNTMMTDILFALRNAFAVDILDGAFNSLSQADEPGAEMIDDESSVSFEDEFAGATNDTQQRRAMAISMKDEELAVDDRRHLLVLHRSEPLVVGAFASECPVEAPKGLLCQRIEVSVDVTVFSEEILGAVNRVQAAFAEFVHSGELLEAIRDANPDTAIEFASPASSLTASSVPSGSPESSPSTAPSDRPSYRPSQMPTTTPSDIPSTHPSVMTSSAPTNIHLTAPKSDGARTPAGNKVAFLGLLLACEVLLRVITTLG